jgi:hypothetical protein
MALGHTVSNRLKVRAAYQSQQGDLIVRFEENKRLFPSGNTVFFKRGSKLQQIELSLTSQEDGATEISFSNGAFSFKSDSGSLYCKGQGIELKALAPEKLAELSSDILHRKMPLEHLPENEEPVYLLQVKGSDELVYVTSPQFNFHGNYHVTLIRNGQRKAIATVEAPYGPNQEQAGLIQFKNGGALYVPGAIDLFLPPAKHRGSATLVRDQDGPIEELMRPQLSPERLKKLGIRPAKATIVPTPCSQ